jgi:argininosuccinate synthase
MMKINDEVLYSPDRKLMGTIVDVAEDHIKLHIEVKLYDGEFDITKLATVGKLGYETNISTSDKTEVKGGEFTLWELEEKEW